MARTSARLTIHLTLEIDVEGEIVPPDPSTGFPLRDIVGPKILEVRAFRAGRFPPDLWFDGDGVPANAWWNKTILAQCSDAIVDTLLDAAQ